MAGFAVFGRRFIEQNLFPIDPLGQIMTLCAPRFLVGPLQRKRSALLVIEQRRFPLRAVVALHATRGSIFSELLAVNILVAVFALRRCRLEVHIDQLGLHVRRLVAVDTGSGAVRPDQRKIRLGVIELL